MIKKTTICGLVFLIVLSSVQPVFAQESERIKVTEISSQDSLEQLSSDQVIKIPNFDDSLSKSRKTEISEDSFITPETQLTEQDLTENSNLDRQLNQNLNLSDLETDLPEDLSNNSTLENAEQPMEIPQNKDLLFNMVLKNKEDRHPLKGKTFKLQNDMFTGALTFEYPIQVPPGRNGLQPDLSLIYNSQNTDNDNIFGYGWSINIPYIQRINKKGVNNLYSNYFSSSMDGELETISLTYNGYGTYGAKVENGEFLKYEYKNNGSWEVIDKNGLIYKFGVTSGSTSGARQHDPDNFMKNYKWMLEEVRDTNDNFIKYEYLYDEGQIYPSKIKYTGNGNTDGIFSIEFFTKTRPDQNISYGPDFKVNTKYLISSIKKNYADSTSQQYNLEYSTGDNGKRSVLTKITEQGNDLNGQIVQLPADKFDYQKNIGTWGKNFNYTVPVDLYNGYHGEESGARIFDVNGDALPDIVFAKKGQPAAVYINKGDDTGWQQNFSYSVPVYFVDEYGKDLGVRIGDVNGDHLEDLIEATPWTTNSYGAVKGKVYLNQGNDKGWTQDYNYDSPYSITFISENNVDTGIRIADINGDGLVDIVGTKIGEMYLNKADGTGWILANYGSYLKPPQGSVLIDVNGDGLVDSISAQASQVINDQLTGPKGVYVNTGKDWQLDSKYYVPVYFADTNGSDQGVRIDDANGDGLPDIFHANGADSFDKWKVYINKGDGTGWEADSQYVIPDPFIFWYSNDNGVRLADVNGDGLADFVSRKDTSNNKGSVYTHPGKISDLMYSFFNKKGGSEIIDYLTSPRYKDKNNKLLNSKLPFLIPLVQKITTSDNLSTSIVSTYKYESGEFFYKNPMERKFAGFKIISEKNSAGYVTKNYYHQGNVTETAIGELDAGNLQFGDAVAKIGELFASEKYDEKNKLYSKFFQRWNHSSLGNNRDFVRLEQKVEITYDGGQTSKSRAEKYSYDLNNGNLMQKTLMGEVQVSDDALKQGTIVSDLGSDNFTIDISYALDSGKKINLPALEVVKDQNLNKIKETQTFYDNLPLLSATKGNVTKQSAWINGSKYSSITKNYNNYGLVTQENDPLGNATTYEYDQYNLYPKKITNAFNKSESYTYDYSSGAIKEYIDLNGGKFETFYDIFDRIQEIKHQDPVNPGNMISNTNYYYYDKVFPTYFAELKKFDGNKGPITYNYFDGLGRIIQGRQEIENGNVFVVKDFKYNNLGLVEQESLPYISNGAVKTVATSNDSLYIKYSYDPLNRIKTIQNVLGLTTNIHDHWKNTVMDPENNSKDYYNDAYGNLIKVVEYNEGKSYITEYKYNGFNNLTKTTDALGNIQTFSYDGLGRRIGMQALHAANDTTFGTYSFTYDDAGNLISKIDANGQTINHTYDKLNRPISEDFTGQSGIETSYKYDNCNKGIGKLCSATEANVTTSYDYNLLGQPTSEKISIDGKDYLTQFTYDFQNNLLTLIYPDGSVNSYGYNVAGKLKNLKHQGKDIVKNINYSPIGAIEKIEYGNGTITTNTYDSQKFYRLSDKETKLINPIQKLQYSYDKVGDITQIIDSSKKPDSMPAIIAKNATYQYDNIYRLKSANITNTSNNQNYSQSYTYNSIGNILSKTGQGSYVYDGGIANSYATPHAVTNIGNTNFSYDKNGNLLSDGKQTYKWDHKDRLIEAVGNGFTNKYLYNHAGQRVKKSDGKNWTIYINKFYEIRNGEVIKHIMAGDENFASVGKIIGNAKPILPNSGPNEIVYEDAEDGKTLGWTAYNPLTSVLNSYENEKQGKVIILKSPVQKDSPEYGLLNYGGYKLKKDDGTDWGDTIDKFFSFDLNSKPLINIQIALLVETTAGDKYLEYRILAEKNSAQGNYIIIKLDNSILDGNWHTITRDLQVDVDSVLPGVKITKINSLQIWWDGKIDNIKLDNIKLMKSLTNPNPQPAKIDTIVYEDAEDGDVLGWKSYVGLNAQAMNIYDTEKKSNVISLPPNSVFSLKNEDETYWNDETRKVLSLDLLANQKFDILVNVSTNNGNKKIMYQTAYSPGSKSKENLPIALDSSFKDGKWHNLILDLQADLSKVQPDTVINKVQFIEFITVDKVDNVKLLKSASGIVPDPIAFDKINYEDAEDGDTLGWKSFVSGYSAKNLFDQEKQSKIISLYSLGGFELKNENGTDWNNSTHKNFSFDVKASAFFDIRLTLNTGNGLKYLVYSTLVPKNSADDSNIYIKLDKNILDGKWHTVSRDILADINSIAPGITFNDVKYLRAFGYGKTLNLDNISLFQPAGAPVLQEPKESTPPLDGNNPKTVSEVIYHHDDHLSGTNIETDEKGNVIEMTDYYPFGEIRVDQSFDSGGVAVALGYKNPYKFTGKELDTDIGLYYYGARYYNPAIGRFVSMDPWEGDIKDPQSLNRYSYVRNSPLRYVDPTGMFLLDNLIEGERWLWKGAIATYLYPKGLTFSGDFLWHSLQDDPDDLVFDDNSSLVKVIKDSEEYKEVIDRIKTRINKGELEGIDPYLGFKTGDLSTSLGKVGLEYKATKNKKNNTYDVAITISDIYDFEFKLDQLDDAFTTFVNNKAWYDQFFGVIQEYKIKINLNTSIKIDEKSTNSKNTSKGKKSSTTKKKK